MRQACVRLASAVVVANESEQIPDAAMGKLYERARTLLAAGAADCEAGIVSQREGVEDTVTHTKASLLNQAVTDFNTGIASISSLKKT